jgi:hypothetical protein
MQSVLSPTLINQLYQLVTQLSVEEQLNFADQVRKQALTAKWRQFIETAPIIEPDISEEEIIAEVKAVRAKLRNPPSFQEGVRGWW